MIRLWEAVTIENFKSDKNGYKCPSFLSPMVMSHQWITGEQGDFSFPQKISDPSSLCDEKSHHDSSEMLWFILSSTSMKTIVRRMYAILITWNTNESLNLSEEAKLRTFKCIEALDEDPAVNFGRD